MSTGAFPRRVSESIRTGGLHSVRRVIDERSVLAVEREMAQYYDAEEEREGRPLDPRRLAARDRFIGAVRAAGRDEPIVEIGAGPGRDAVEMVDAGLAVIGVDLSFGHAARAASRGLTMARASARELPFATASIGALWSMSTLMHIPEVAIDGAMQEIARVLVAGAPVAIGVWGGPDTEHFLDGTVAGSRGPRRLFSRRSEPRWRALLEVLGHIDDFDLWANSRATDDDAAFYYHLAFITAHGGAGR